MIDPTGLPFSRVAVIDPTNGAAAPFSRIALIDPVTGAYISSGGGSSSGPLSSAVRQVATRCALPTTFFAGSPTAILSRSTHAAADDISAVQIETPNFYINSTTFVESPTGAAATVASWVEYPRGTYTAMTYSGGATGTAPNGGRVLSDSVTLPLRIPRGAQFWVWQRFVNTAGVVFVTTTSSLSNGGDIGAYNVATNAVPPMIPSTAGDGLYFPPSAILGSTTRRSFAIFGDSRSTGYKDKRSGLSPDQGEIARGLGLGKAAYIDMAQVGYSMSALIASHANLAAIAAYCSDLILQIGINDVTAGVALATLQGNYSTIKGYVPTATAWLTTKPPVTTSTDAWATTANQTTHASNAVRVNLNNWARGIPAGYQGFFEIADALESARDSGRWKAPVTTGPGAGLGPWTDDGTHALPMAYEFIRDNGFVNPGAFQ